MRMSADLKWLTRKLLVDNELGLAGRSDAQCVAWER